jgi:hypothetical protein
LIGARTSLICVPPLAFPRQLNVVARTFHQKYSLPPHRGGRVETATVLILRDTRSVLYPVGPRSPAPAVGKAAPPNLFSTPRVTIRSPAALPE